MKKYKVACYVKNALLWRNRNPEEMIECNRAYFEKKLSGSDTMEFVDVYVDVTGHKETYKRPEMIRLINDFMNDRINFIYARTSGYIAANAHELCMLMEFLFEQNKEINFYTEDPVYQFNTIDNNDNQLEELKRMAKAYSIAYADDYLFWKSKLTEQIEKISHM